jgi:hypothetical protein
LAASLLIIASFIPGWRWTYRERGIRDSRAIFMDWLVATSRPNRRTLVVEELAFLPKELKRVSGPVVVAPWSETKALVERRDFDTFVYGSFDLAGAVQSSPVPAGDLVRLEAWLATLKIEAQVGSAKTPVYPNFWRSNHELIVAARLSPDGRQAP